MQLGIGQQIVLICFLNEVMFKDAYWFTGGVFIPCYVIELSCCSSKNVPTTETILLLDVSMCQGLSLCSKLRVSLEFTVSASLPSFLLGDTEMMIKHVFGFVFIFIAG